MKNIHGDVKSLSKKKGWSVGWFATTESNRPASSLLPEKEKKQKDTKEIKQKTKQTDERKLDQIGLGRSATWISPTCP